MGGGGGGGFLRVWNGAERGAGETGERRRARR